MEACKCIVPTRHGGTLNSRRAASPLVRLVEGEERVPGCAEADVNDVGQRFQNDIQPNNMSDAKIIAAVTVEEKLKTLENDEDGEKAAIIIIYLKDEDLKNYDKIKSIMLQEFEPTPQSCLENFKKATRQTCESHVQFASRLTTNWEYYLKLRDVSNFEVCFSDESTFEIFQNKAQFVRRRRGEKFNSDCVVQIVKHPTKITIWSVISGKGTGCLKVVKGMMRQDQYKDVLQNRLIPQLEEWFPNGESCIFYARWSSLPYSSIYQSF
ncbi:uncharacterized protein TNCV_155491 [Trichonephila clavipes]|uniref:Uncharacterized protein n=1 Tax=Trichonephila clavipes TaxID=2585209 RepID=A0A8X6WH37_TRICX|nr:uncharacterized protein TNCV_155491 [Trichonephila clavipes]